MPSITAFSPTTLSAGTNQILTIQGSGFGSSPGLVLFDSPNDGQGGAFALVGGAAILSWSDTQITVNVTNAGTGRIGVQNSSGQTSFSANNLLVTYAVISLFDPSVGSFVNGRLIDDLADGNGGYTMLLSSSTANNGASLANNSAALQAVERVVETWQSQSNYAIYAGESCGTTSVQTPSIDGVNVISFDNNAYDLSAEVGADVTGIAFSVYSKCSSSEFEIVEIDIILRRGGNPSNFNWHYGTGAPSGNTVSFEAILLHEIGHAAQLDHVNDNTQSMYYISNSASPVTSLGSSDLAGAAYIQSLAMGYNPPLINCGGDFNSPRPYQGYLPDEDCSVALPVTYLFFEAKRQGQQVLLDWATASEENNARFVVERSGDARQFQPIATIAGHGNSQVRQDYRLTDTSPLDGINYYRLAQIDYDGSMTYSDIRSVRFDKAASSLQLFPNPVQQQLNVRVESSPQDRIWQLLDASGRLVKTGQIAATTDQISIPLNELPSAVYWWKLTGESPQRLVKK